MTIRTQALNDIRVMMQIASSDEPLTVAKRDVFMRKQLLNITTYTLTVSSVSITRLFHHVWH